MNVLFTIMITKNKTTLIAFCNEKKNNIYLLYCISSTKHNDCKCNKLILCQLY